jgi:hypothetical protein
MERRRVTAWAKIVRVFFAICHDDLPTFAGPYARVLWLTAVAVVRAATRASGDRPLIERSSAKMALNNCLERGRWDRTRFTFTCLRGDVGKLEQLAPRMRPAAGFSDWSRLSCRPIIAESPAACEAGTPF